MIFNWKLQSSRKCCGPWWWSFPSALTGGAASRCSLSCSWSGPSSRWASSSWWRAWAPSFTRYVFIGEKSFPHNVILILSILRTFSALILDTKVLKKKCAEKKTWQKMHWVEFAAEKSIKKKTPIFLEWLKLHEIFLIKFILPQIRTLQGKVVRNSDCKIINTRGCLRRLHWLNGDRLRRLHDLIVRLFCSVLLGSSSRTNSTAVRATPSSRFPSQPWMDANRPKKFEKLLEFKFELILSVKFNFHFSLI